MADKQINRRTFLAASTAAATGLAAGTPARPAAVAPSELAMNGGRPVRATRLSANYWGTQYYDDVEERELLDVVRSRSPFRWYGPGKPVKVLNFERAFAARQHTKYAIGVTSGTGALLSAVNALGVGPGDEMILPAWTWYSCYNAIVLSGALPVFAEIDTTLNIDPTDVERKITPRTKAIMAVHILGGPADIDPVMEIAKRRRLRVLEDCAQCVGGSHTGRPVGSIGDIGIYSFQLHKTITAGEGGAIVTSDPMLFERASRFHDLGGLRPPHEEMIGKGRMSWFVGGQFRMSEFTGAVMGSQLRKLDTILAATRGHSRRIRQAIADLPGIRLRRMPDPDGDTGYGVFIELKDKPQRDQFIKAMNAENVAANTIQGSVILPTVPHIEQKIGPAPGWASFSTPEGKSMRYGAECCPRTLGVYDRFVEIHLDPKWTRPDVDDVIAAVTKVYGALIAPRV